MCEWVGFTSWPTVVLCTEAELRGVQNTSRVGSTECAEHASHLRKLEPPCRRLVDVEENRVSLHAPHLQALPLLQLLELQFRGCFGSSGDDQAMPEKCRNADNERSTEWKRSQLVCRQRDVCAWIVVAQAR
eukprot:2053717-Prymnesium_polylepis.1